MRSYLLEGVANFRDFGDYPTAHGRRVVAGRYALRDLLWEVQGAASYLAHRVRKCIAD